MKQIWIFILFLFIVSCKSPKQKEEVVQLENTIKQNEQTEIEQKKAEEVVEKEIKSEPKRVNPRDTLTYLEKMALREKEKAKRDSFLAQFDTLYSYVDSTVIVKGIIQGSGLTKNEGYGIKSEYQLTNPKKSFFLVSDKNLTDYWGKCVSVVGRYISGWNFESGSLRKPYAYDRTAIQVETIEIVSNDYCFNSPVFKSISENELKENERDTLVKGHIVRMKRFSPDFPYDYQITFSKPIFIYNPWESTGKKDYELKSAILLSYLPLDILNILIENKREVELFGYVIGGYQSIPTFRCKDFNFIK